MGQTRKPGDLSTNQVEAAVRGSGGPNPHPLKRVGMRIGEKFQSNPEIAGSPEIALGLALVEIFMEVEH